jgi:Rho-associated protein kinase 2
VFECRRLKHELETEKEKFNQMVAKYQADLQNLQATLYEESQARLKLSMELDTKESEVENLQMKITHLNIDAESISRGTGTDMDGDAETSLKGWLHTPSKQNIRRHGWKKLYIVVSSRKIIFFNSETDKQNSDPSLILDLNKVFHVRSVTQGDVIRADAKEIPRIFQVLYAGEGESRKPDENATPPVMNTDAEKIQSTIVMKGHEFVQISFHMPASCESCTKPLWAPFRPPPAVECRRCRIKLHKDHTSGNGESVVPCKVSYDPTTAKEMLLMAPTVEEQQFWVARLLKRIQKSGYKAAGQGDTGSVKISPQESMRSEIQNLN